MAATLSLHASVITALPDMITTIVRGLHRRDSLDQLFVFWVQSERCPIAANSRGARGGPLRAYGSSSPA